MSHTKTETPIQYNYHARTEELKQINLIRSVSEKKRCLQRFIAAEETLLMQLTPPTHRSQALDSAKLSLGSIASIQSPASPPSFYLPIPANVAVADSDADVDADTDAEKGSTLRSLAARPML